MKTIEVTDKIADRIEKIRTDAGMHEEKALICDAMAVAVSQYDQLERYDADSHLPLTALSMYRDLIDEIAKTCHV
ncbi:hypothetical protein [Prevotella intermedia]|uniref:Uncharacterized protein n=1 Tax=Prevotella intermedia TaxID=28131 RepID=A0A2A6EEE3_PREIN|nr:hypothetical protein [Prevotella intermedia]PDP59671.1 hypothetical protein CLI71_08565 [Prevotella intermedia]